MINSIDDFCLWGSPNANETVADTEEEMVSRKPSKARRLDVLKRFYSQVAYCTTPKYGTRVLPAGALQGVQLCVPAYVQKKFLIC